MKRDFVNDWTIDGKPILSPDNGLAIDREDLEDEDSGYDESGFYHSIIRRFGIRHVTLSYSYLTQEEYKYMESLVRNKATFKFVCVDLGKSVQFTARCRKTSVNWVNKKSGLHQNYKLTIIEC